MSKVLEKRYPQQNQENLLDEQIEKYDEMIADCDDAIAGANIFIYGSVGSIGVLAVLMWGFILFKWVTS